MEHHSIRHEIVNHVFDDSKFVYFQFSCQITLFSVFFFLFRGLESSVELPDGREERGTDSPMDTLDDSVADVVPELAAADSRACLWRVISRNLWKLFSAL